MGVSEKVMTDFKREDDVGNFPGLQVAIHALVKVLSTPGAPTILCSRSAGVNKKLN